MQHNWFSAPSTNGLFRWQCIHCKASIFTQEDKYPPPTRNVWTSDGKQYTCEEWQIHNVQEK